MIRFPCFGNQVLDLMSFTSRASDAVTDTQPDAELNQPFPNSCVFLRLQQFAASLDTARLPLIQRYSRQDSVAGRRTSCCQADESPRIVGSARQC